MPNRRDFLLGSAATTAFTFAASRTHAQTTQPPTRPEIAAEPELGQQDGTYLELIAHNEWQPFEYLATCDYAACQIGYFKLRSLLSQ